MDHSAEEIDRQVPQTARHAVLARATQTLRLREPIKSPQSRSTT
jgi:hypothetical protein